MGKLERMKAQSAQVGNAALSTKQEIENTKIAMTQKVSGSEYKNLRLEAIELNPDNDYGKNDSDEDIAVLADDIERNGLLHNIVVSNRDGGEFVLLSGERRLKALKLLAADPQRNKNGKWNEAMVKVIYGLDRLDEMIYLDSANLQIRGGAGGEEDTIRRATKRYSDNLIEKYGISQAAADELTKQISGQNERSVERNLKLERDLLQGLKKLLDDGELPKREALILMEMTPDEQEEASKYLTQLVEEGTKAELQPYDFQHAKAMVLAAAGEQNDVNRRTLMDAAIADAKAALSERRKKVKAGTTKSEADAKKHAQYLMACDKMLVQVRAMGRKRTATNIKRLDEDAAADQSIKQKLGELSKAIDELKASLE